MARLPRVSDNTVLTQAPRSTLSAADIANPYMAVADALGTVGTVLQEREVRQANEQGANGVYRDEQGNLKVDLRSDFSKSGDAYNRAAMQAYTARLAGDIRTKGTTLANDAKGDVDLFGSSWKGFSDTLIKSVPESARGAVKTMLETEGSRLGLGVSEQKRTRDIKTFEGDIKAEIQALDDDMAALARAGGTSSRDYRDKQSQLHSLYGELASNPEFSVGEREAQIEVKRTESRHTTEAVLGHIDRTLATGGVTAARKEAEKILADTTLTLTPAERRQYNGLANEAIRTWGAQKKVELEPVKEKSKKLQSLLDEGIGIDSHDIDETARLLAAGGDMAGALELYAARSRARQIVAFQGANDADQTAALERGSAAARGINTGPVDSLVAAIRQTESAGNPNAVSPAGAIGSMQVMPGTAAEIAAELGDADFPTDPERQKEYLKRDDVSTRYGTHYLNKMLARYGGDTEAALVAYNGGPERADAWIAAGRDDSVLPAETSDYYKKVLAVPGSRGVDLPVVTRHQSGRVSAPDMSGVKPDVLNRFKAFQNAFGASVPVVSGFRDPARNARARGAKSSRHIKGDALDLDVTGMSSEERVRLIRTASAYGFTGIGVYRDSIHLDTGSRRAWGPDHHSGSVPDWAAAVIGEHKSGQIAQLAPAAAPEVDPAVIKEMRAEVTSDAKDLWDDMKSGMEKNLPPSPEELGLLTRQLALIDDEDFRSEVSRFFETEAGAAIVSDLPADQAAAIISGLKNDAADGASIAQQGLLEAMERGAKQRAEALRVDPVGFAIDRKLVDPIPPFNVSGDPVTFGQSVGVRQRAVDILRARGDVGNVSALRPEDETVLSRFIQTATPAEQARVIGSIASNLKPDTYLATMAKLSEKADTRSMAIAGALYRDNPEVAEGILRGRQLLRENGKLAPSDHADNRADIDTILPPTVFAPAMEGPRQQLLEAATARYADLSHLAGDTSGDLNDTRMTQAINEVTGGMLDMNGTSIIAPRYGMTQDEFDTALGGLTDADLAYAATSEGASISARELRTYGRLKAIGEGEYLVEFGPEGGATYAMSKPRQADSRMSFVGGGPFVLNLGDR